jgi:hypothetical protein
MHWTSRLDLLTIGRDTFRAALPADSFNTIVI